VLGKHAVQKVDNELRQMNIQSWDKDKTRQDIETEKRHTYLTTPSQKLPGYSGA